MINKIDTKNMSEEEWLKARRAGVGGSDMGAICNMNAYRGPYAVWADKTGRTELSTGDNEAMRIGRDLEQYTADRFCEASGKKVRRVNAMLSNDDYPHVLINIDREVVGEDSILECKTASAFGADKFRDGIPDSYYVQCVTYMGVYECSRCYLAALILGIGLKIYMLTTHEDDTCPDFCEQMIYVDNLEFDAIKQVVAEFWGYVERDEEPPVDATRDTTDIIKARYPESVAGIEIDATGIRSNLKARAELKAQIDELKAELDVHENIIKNYMKDAERGSCEGWSVSYKSSTRNTLDSKRVKAEHPEIEWDEYNKATITRTLRVQERK